MVDSLNQFSLEKIEMYYKMSSSTLQYDDYKKINELIEGYTNITPLDSALANRPLDGIKHECPCKMQTRNDLTHVKPYFDNGEFQSSVSSDSKKEIPVIIQKHRNQYLVLEDNKKKDEDVYSDNWAEPPLEKDRDGVSKPKMDLITRFYFGSISVVALFVVFRMIQKTK